ncbi:Smr/MutS family protein [Candidatus Neoehrlichia procyonis]|uniref:Smr domain protein n=1 Tax=Candidatus Neoehrlichia procyonis str. RAC413 TaxID=1359163 RepID=A0A0F3NKY5_9RICK|nr:Smr/MutS family protein [Candidatus Neoehrlichia lotoris]KJV68690.1 smr domain protein [Candidatus Neoehrlichia lotoris str. RAC413]
MSNSHDDNLWKNITKVRPLISNKVSYHKHNNNSVNITHEKHLNKNLTFHNYNIPLNINKTSYKKPIHHNDETTLPYYDYKNKLHINTQNKIYNIESGIINSISNSTKAKIDQGKYRINSIIDLHGYTIDEAYYQLFNCIIKNYNLGNKCLLIITGWGSKNSCHSIRNNLHKWLQNEKISNLILYYKQAISSHGGKGAFYLLLKTKDKCL